MARLRKTAPLRDGAGHGRRRYRHALTPLTVLALLQFMGGPSAAASTQVRGGGSRACDAVREPPVAEAVAEARRRLAATWLQIGDNWYSAYRLKAQPRNPFDLKAPPERPVHGYIWAGGLACAVARSTRPDTVIVRFTGRAVSFNENGAGWTKPLTNAVMLSVAVAREGEQLVAIEQAGDSSIAMEDEETRLPTQEELPPPDEKLGIPCAASFRWHRSKCVPETESR